LQIISDKLIQEIRLCSSDEFPQLFQIRFDGAFPPFCAFKEISEHGLECEQSLITLEDIIGDLDDITHDIGSFCNLFSVDRRLGPINNPFEENKVFFSFENCD